MQNKKIWKVQIIYFDITFYINLTQPRNGPISALNNMQRFCTFLLARFPIGGAQQPRWQYSPVQRLSNSQTQSTHWQLPQDQYVIFQWNVPKNGEDILIIIGEVTCNSTSTRAKIYCWKYCINFTISLLFGSEDHYPRPSLFD